MRHLTTRLHEHQRSSAPVSQHLVKCAPNVTFPTAKILDRTRNASKLLTLEALYIDRLNPALNQRRVQTASTVTKDLTFLILFAFILIFTIHLFLLFLLIYLIYFKMSDDAVEVRKRLQ